MRHLLLLLVLLLAPPVRAEGPPTLGKGDPTLVSAFSAALSDDALAGARASVLVVRLSDGAPLYAYQADARLHPASNTKLVTTAAALIELGPAHTWQTDLAVDALGRDGVAKTVYLVGGGDPHLMEADLWRLAQDARLRGLERVDGDLVVDESWFGPQHEAPGFGDKLQDSAYRAPTGATTLNWDAVTVRVLPGAVVGAAPRVILQPAGDYVDLVVTATTTRKGREQLAVAATPHKGRTRIAVSGRIPLAHGGVVVRRRIDDPALFAGHAAKALLASVGIKVKGRVVVGVAPAKRKRLGRHTSRSLAVAAADVNKYSNNIMAEHLVRTLGKEKGGAGDWDAGRAVVNAFLEDRVGLRKGFVYRNGSGLFGDTAFSAADLVAVLRYVADLRPSMPEYEASLAIGGADGTLRKRMRKSPARSIRAKTGTLDGVIALSGYVTFADGSRGAFSVLFNDVKARPWAVWKVHDRLVDAMTRFTPTR